MYILKKPFFRYKYVITSKIQKLCKKILRTDVDLLKIRAKFLEKVKKKTKQEK